MGARRSNVNVIPAGTALTVGANNFDVETPQDAVGVLLFFHVTTHPGVETCDVRIHFLDPVSGDSKLYFVFVGGLPNSAAPSDNFFAVVPFAHNDTDGTIQCVIGFLPAKWRLVLTPSASAGWVLSCSAQFF